MKSNDFSIKKLVLAGLMLALALYLPFLTGQIPEIGKALAPMHLPVIIAGFLCGPKLGLIVGLIAPMLRSLLFGMPPMFPVATIMTFELAAYGFTAGLLYDRLKKTLPNIFVSLIGAMLVGRVVWGIASFVISLMLVKMNFGIQAFIAGAFIKAIPGIILQLIVVPMLVLVAQKVGVIEKRSS